ncbi:MAG: efflux RND transporter periplasmic adaptor subunit [Magnetococcales bacterium]|nr:efflux RND transporter periplasmic adaptor subunit [Magnetococcales bacterium]
MKCCNNAHKKNRVFDMPVGHIHKGSHCWTLLLALLFYLLPLPAMSKQESPKVLIAPTQYLTLIEEVRLSGSVVSPRIAKLSTQVSGIVENISVDLGDQVKAGDEILKLDSELERLALSEAQAVTDKVDLELADARRRLADAQKLAKHQVVSANRISTLITEVQTQKAELKRIKVKQLQLKARLRRHRITAPFDGVISKKWSEIGEWLNPGNQVVELTALKDVNIDFLAPQSVMAKLNDKAKIRIYLDALSDQAFYGQIVWAMPIADSKTRTFRLRTSLTEITQLLAPGMSASAILQLHTGRKGITVPRDALIRHPDGRITVWVIDGNGKVVRVSEKLVKTGLQFNGMITIIEGLSPGEQVVVQGNESLRNGQKVTIQGDR